MISRSQNGLPFLHFEVFSALDRVQHAIFTRQGGVSPAPFNSLNLSVSVPDEKARVYANRKRAYGLFGRDTDTVVHAHLVHGAQVARVSPDDNGTWISRVDGIITNTPGCALTMNFADCAPILLYDPDNHAIALGHAGWRGAVVDLPGAMVRAMNREFGSRPGSLLAAIGPSIGACCYEVGMDVIDAVQTSFDEPEALLSDPATADEQDPNLHRRYFDLPEANRRNLERAGVTEIEMSGFCTACRTDLFYSHRAEKGKTGRFGAILLLN